MTKITKLEVGVKWSHFSPFCDEKCRFCDPLLWSCNLSATVPL